MSSVVRRVAAAATIGLATACGGGTSTSPTPPATSAPPAPLVARVTVNGSAPAVGSTAQLTATAAFSDSTSQDVTTRATWQSSSAAIATISAAGVVTAVAPGDVEFSATFQNVTGSLRLSIARPEPVRYTLTGVISDGAARSGIASARLEVVSGANAGMAATADASGAYRLEGLLAGTFRLRASANGFDAGEQNVTVPANPQADFLLNRQCTVAASPSSYYVSKGGFLTPSTPVVVTAASGCDWTVSTPAFWLFVWKAGTSSLPLSHSVSGSGGMTIDVGANSTSCHRTTQIVVSAAGGSVVIAVDQGADVPACPQ